MSENKSSFQKTNLNVRIKKRNKKPEKVGNMGHHGLDEQCPMSTAFWFLKCVLFL